jgi:hypothetical protein
MNAQFGSVRYWLQRSAYLSVPNDIRPFNHKWKFRHYQHNGALRRFVKQLREIADGLEQRLNKIEQQVQEHNQP